jgi:predicted DNA-binding protein YlxM (UPF0122 family)
MTEKEQFKIIQDKLKIANKRTVKQILAHKELCEDIIKRDVISEHELVEEYEIPQSHLKNLKTQGKISFFTSAGELNKTNRGTKSYYFVDEVKDLFGYNIRYNKSFMLKNNIFSKLIVDISSKLLTEKETKMLDMLLRQNVSIDEIAEEFSLSKERTNQIVSKAARRMIGRIHNLHCMFADYYTALDYKTENTLLKQQNKELYRKFLRNQEDQANKEANSKPIIQHFIKYGYDIKDLTKEFLFHEALSVRAVGCLRAANINNIEELLSYHKSDLLKFRNMGNKTLNEICYWLEYRYNLQLKN